ncbi:MAG: hypothetical protein ACLR8Q_01045 [[Ruminococcus] lactaris]|uniref:hypothetical protein n=1 Tax=[Ruminococcus] lactaris TaxID=46228 RepID=UPI00399F3E57
MHKYWYTILLSFSLFIAAGCRNDRRCSDETGSRKDSETRFCRISRHPGSCLPRICRSFVNSSGDSASLRLPKSSAVARSPESSPSPSEPSKTSGNAPGEPGADGWKKELGAVSPDLTDVLFIGDSRTVGLSEYGDLGNADVFADSGMSVFNLLDSKPKKGAGSDKTLNQLLEEKIIRPSS